MTLLDDVIAEYSDWLTNNLPCSVSSVNASIEHVLEFVPEYAAGQILGHIPSMEVL